MQIVKFRDGKYGMRKFSFNPFSLGWVYKDFCGRNRYWWSTTVVGFNDCKVSIETLKTYLDEHDGVCTVVKDFDAEYRKYKDGLVEERNKKFEKSLKKSEDGVS